MVNCTTVTLRRIFQKIVWVDGEMLQGCAVVESPLSLLSYCIMHEYKVCTKRLSDIGMTELG